VILFFHSIQNGKNIINLSWLQHKTFICSPSLTLPTLIIQLACFYNSTKVTTNIWVWPGGKRLSNLQIEGWCDIRLVGALHTTYMVEKMLEQVDAVRSVLSEDGTSAHLPLTWQDHNFLQSVLQSHYNIW